MSLRRTASLTTTAALIGALVFAGSVSPATALGEADGLYSVSDENDNQFVQLDKTNASVTLIGSSSDLYEFRSVEVVDGLGYAHGYILGPDDEENDDDVLAVFTWNISTGAVLTAVPLTSDIDLEDVYALDTRLDGVLIAYAYFDDDEADQWIVSINHVTGAVTRLVDLSDIDDGRLFEGLATNPVDGITYALADYDNGIPAASPVNFATATVGDSVSYPEIADSLGSGWFSEGDFDASGVLWFTYSGGVSRTDAPFEVGVDATELGEPDIRSKAITIGSGTAPAAAPELADTGAAVDAVPMAAAGLALFALGGVLMVARRRSRA